MSLRLSRTFIESLSILSLILAASAALSDPIYLGQDSKGRTIYSSKPTGSGAVVAELPALQHESEAETKGEALFSCQPHGGIDCHAGADSDGSVICRDSFTDAAARFMEHCIEARLTIGDVVTSGSDGSFRVLIRNNAAVDARAVVVSYRPKLSRRVDLNGPSTIEPFGVAEYAFVPTERLLYGTKPLAAQIMLQCENCEF